MTEYPRIERLIRRVRFAPHGQKRALQRTLRKARLASLKREIARRHCPQTPPG